MKKVNVDVVSHTCELQTLHVAVLLLLVSKIDIQMSTELLVKSGNSVQS